MATAALGSALASAAIQMIGPVSETLTQVVQFSILDFFTASTKGSSSSTSQAQDKIVRIRAGADDGGTQRDLGGNTPLVVSWDANLNRVGDSSEDSNSYSISNGQFANIKISGGRQTPTLDFTAGGTDGFAFDGSWFKWCNMWWYHSSISLTTSTGAKFQPPCGWLDGDKSEGHALVGFRVDMLELQNIPNVNAWGKNDVQEYCTRTFQSSGSMQGQYLKGNLDTKGDGSKGQKRELSGSSASVNKTVSMTDQAGHRKKLVVSSYEGQSAQELCDSEKSRGPDFVSIAEEKYCDMSKKKMYRLCSTRYYQDCFSLDEGKKRLRRRGDLDSSGDGDVHRESGQVDRWGPA